MGYDKHINIHAKLQWKYIIQTYLKGKSELYNIPDCGMWEIT